MKTLQLRQIAENCNFSCPDQGFSLHDVTIAWSNARKVCASPPSGRPGRFESFQAYTSICAQAISFGTNRCRKSAATIAPAIGLAETLFKSAIVLSNQELYASCNGNRHNGSCTDRPAP